MPRFDGIGADEFIVTGPLGHCDLISSVDTQPYWELTSGITLSTAASPCISGEHDFPASTES